ncbi:S41 family peptidase [Myroides guanonis]|uniref:Peptidase family S41 n=1 Tax=Myroides guanonis TaxID=1150112 RepID=A0A1I3M1Y9_9FLAO|nr:S41 family peptidase [Myroides guanonis]SFI90810.1 Peptidase family S41 [Myroides guanonis]
MKSKFLLIFLFITNFSWSQIAEQQKIETWVKVWGFLKYNHPRVAAGVTDWDGVFVSHLQVLDGLRTEEEINKAYLELLNSLGTVKLCDACKTIVTQETSNNINYEELWKGTELSPLILKRLDFIRTNRSLDKNYYVQFYKDTQLPLFKNERVVSFDPLPNKERRLLALARFWNVINYFYPYKSLMTDKWDVVLPQMIPLFISSTTDFGYQYAIILMTRFLEDSNAFVASELLKKRIGDYRPSFSIVKIEDKWMVDRMEIDSLSSVSRVLSGDEILAIDGKKIDELVEDKEGVISSSNERTKNNSLATTLLNGSSGNMEVTVLRNIDTLSFVTPRYLVTEFFPDSDYNENLPWKILDSSVGYIDVGRFLKRDQVPMQRDFKNLNNLIIDLRSYEVPSGNNLADYLVLKNKVFAQMIEPNSKAVGSFIERKKMHENKNAKNSFTGNIYVLVNEKTRGQGEFLALLLKGSDRVKLIGTSTAGAFGLITKLQLPGKVEVFFTGIGVSTADRLNIQKVGVEPDIEIYRNQTDILKGRDTLLEETLLLIKQ